MKTFNVNQNFSTLFSLLSLQGAFLGFIFPNQPPSEILIPQMYCIITYVLCVCAFLNKKCTILPNFCSLVNNIISLRRHDVN